MHTTLCIGEKIHQDALQLLQKKKSLTISGLSNETAKAMVIAHLTKQEEGSILVVVENEEKCEEMMQWLSFFEQHVSTFSLEDGFSPEAFQTFIHLFQNKRGVCILSHDVFRSNVPLFLELETNAVRYTMAENCEFSTIITSLMNAGYEHSDDEELCIGQYCRRGDVLSIFPVNETSVVELHLSFDGIEAILQDGCEKSSITLYPLRYERSAPLRDQYPTTSLLITDEYEEQDLQNNCYHLALTSFPEEIKNHIHLRYLSVLKFYTLPDFINDVRDKLNQDWSLTIVTKRADDLVGVLQEEHLAYSIEEESVHGRITIVRADKDTLLPHSLQNPDLRVALITDREIFTLRTEAKQKSVQRLALDFITSLQSGDFVVHMEHGIGKFQGMTTKVVDDIEREYLEIAYAEGDKLFVPVDQADKLSKYVYEEGREPQLTRLGSQEWKKVTKKVNEETEKIAQELLDIYATRAKAKGYAYPADSEQQRAFDEAFPYTETPGQVKAIEDIKRDMESPHPMDRLVCGDVGFGKTEVAMRAAFKAVQGGKQVAFLSPITILADQHYRSLCERMKGFNVRIDVLSRFRTNAEQKIVLQKLEEGKIDIIVGTHRLLQEDVRFSNLGLLIIDEEQRFGVEQKEKMKQLRSSIDILTMTATPIPRTLNLGLHKLRDITTITTPPPGRLPIITEVRKYSDGLIRESIRKELERGGQAYVLHNRVETIDAFAMKLRALVPEASFVVTHGQLKPEVLEKRIVDFKNGVHTVLVSSTIIENGIDLPRANTLIVNEAEKFGLSQLYQLRGRVGRGSVQAYAYLLYHSQRLKDDAKKRLRAIVEASELGSGFQISMRDLEIRGAGEILGANQSGNMQTVGVSHYLRILKNAVETLQAGGKNEEQESTGSVEIVLPFEALIPAYYITESEEKISVYQKLASSENEEMLAEFEKELCEEYGALPKQVINLLLILKLRMAARRAGVERMSIDHLSSHQSDIVLTLSPCVTALEIMQLLQLCPKWRISGKTLRLSEEVMRTLAHTTEWLPELTKHVAALIKKKEKKGKKSS
jgi:transcription-repair coupling factor (superfamily II helicase)